MGKRSKQIRRNRRRRWSYLTGTDAANFKAEIAGSNVFERVSIAALPPNIRAGMPGLAELYVSHSLDQPTIRDGLVYAGKLVVGRYDGNWGKGYAFVFAYSSSGVVCYCELDKHPTAHYWPSGSPPPVVVIANDTQAAAKIYDF